MKYPIGIQIFKSLISEDNIYIGNIDLTYKFMER